MTTSLLTIEAADIVLQYHYFADTAPWQPSANSWRTRASSWQVAHDLFHHAPADSGTLAEELASLGAEYYVCFEGTGLAPEYGGPEDETAPAGLNSLQRSAAGIVGIEFESCKDFSTAFMLPRIRETEVPEPLRQLFAEAERSAVAEATALFEGHDQETWAGLNQHFMQTGLILAHISQGYHQAKARFPDREKVQASWKHALQALRNAKCDARLGDVLVASRKGYLAEFQLQPLYR